jgi:hypothetical protein
MKALPESVRVRWNFLSSSSVECGSSAGILRITIENQLSESFWCIGVQACQDYPMTLPQSGLFANHRKSLIRCSYGICAFTYHIVELVFVLSYIQFRVWGSVEYSGTRCDDYYLIPRRLTTLIRRKILDSVVNEVAEALSMHVAPPAIQIIVIAIGVIVLLELRNPPHS